MPVFQVNTNVCLEGKADFLSQASSLVASVLGKPESYVMVQLNDNQSMSFAASKALVYPPHKQQIFLNKYVLSSMHNAALIPPEFILSLQHLSALCLAGINILFSG